MGKRKPTPTRVELAFETGKDARDFRRLIAGFDGRAGAPVAPGDAWGYVLPDSPERTPHFMGMLSACAGRVVTESVVSNPLREDEDAPTLLARTRGEAMGPRTPFDPPVPYRVVILTMHQSGPKETVIACDYVAEATLAAEIERGRQTNRRDNAIVRIDAHAAVGAEGRGLGKWKPLVQWTFRGDWKKELQ